MNAQGFALIEYKDGRRGLKIRRTAADTPAEYTARLAHVFSQPEIAGVAYALRTTPFLELDCQARGLKDRGARHKLIARLQTDDQQKPAIRPEMSFVIQSAPPTEYFADPQAAPVGGWAALLLLGLPHDVVRHLMQFLDHCDLFALLFTCKFLHNDALVVIRQRARMLWKDGGSPMALSMYVFRQGATIVTERWHIHNKIAKHGSIDAYRRDRARRRELKLAETEEHKNAVHSAVQRFERVQAMMQSCGWPDLFGYAGGKVHLTTIGQLCWELDNGLKKIVKRLKSHVSRAMPSRLDTLDADIMVTRAAQLRDCVMHAAQLADSRSRRVAAQTIRLFDDIGNQPVFGALPFRRILGSALRNLAWTNYRLLLWDRYTDTILVFPIYAYLLGTALDDRDVAPHVGTAEFDMYTSANTIVRVTAMSELRTQPFHNFAIQNYLLIAI